MRVRLGALIVVMAIAHLVVKVRAPENVVATVLLYALRVVLQHVVRHVEVDVLLCAVPSVPDNVVQHAVQVVDQYVRHHVT